MDFRDFNEFMRDAFKYIVVIAIVLLIVIYVFSFQQVIGPSMNDTLKEDDIVMLNKLKYRLFSVKRGDVVIVKVNEKMMVKRVIGLPGETIEFKNNVLYIDGQSYKENYIKEDTKDFSLSKLGLQVIPEDSYFVLGDNRNDSQDSRSYGPITKSQIVGQAMFRLYPFNKIKIIK